MEILFILLGISIPLGIYFWQEGRSKNPHVRWPKLAAAFGFQYTPNPPRMSGEWKGRDIGLTAETERMLLQTTLTRRTPLRLEIGPREVIERTAGMVVADRVSFDDHAFESVYLVRSTPPEAAQQAVDPALRQTLQRLGRIHILAQTQGMSMTCEVATSGETLRDLLDVASSVADAVDGE